MLRCTIIRFGVGVFDMNINEVIERNQAVGLLAWQCMLRASGLMSLGAISSARKAMDTYLLCLRHGAEYVEQARLTDPPAKLVVVYVDALSDFVEKSWQDFRNHLQILLLTQDEVLIWVARIDRTLDERGRKQ